MKGRDRTMQARLWVSILLIATAAVPQETDTAAVPPLDRKAWVERFTARLAALPPDAEAARDPEIVALQTKPDGFGRIAAQTAKQVIIQRVREAERENLFDQYKDKKGELMTGIVRRFERGNIIVEVDNGRSEGILPVREQVPRESLRGNLLKELINKAYAGSGKELVMAALRGHVSEEEKDEIRRLLQEDGK